MALRDFLRGKKKLPDPDKPKLLPVPDQIDLAALWEEPQDASSMTTILAGVAAVMSSLALILGFFHL